ncbi:hypothetical protein Tco_0091776 [Tanacetum coccineum]
MENKNPIRTLGDYSRPSHEGYRNTIELPDGKNVVPLIEEGKVVDKNIVEPNESDVAKHIEVIDRKEETEGGADVETIKNAKKEPEEEII